MACSFVVRLFSIFHLQFPIRPFSILSFFPLLFLLLYVQPVYAQGDDPPTPTPVSSPTPTHAPLRPHVEPFDGDLILQNPLLWGLARRMLAGLGVANIRDYLAVVFALMGIARFIAKPPTVPE